jgi:hypothetical protein
MAMRLDRLIELLQDCLGVNGDGGDILAKGYNAGDLHSSGGGSVILPVIYDIDDSSVAWIMEGSDLVGIGGGEGVDSLLVVKGGSCNLDASVCDSMANQHTEEVHTVDIYESPRHRPEHVGHIPRHIGRPRRNGERCPRRGRQPPGR